MTAPMKLSDAILKGCEIIPEQAFGAYYRDEEGIAAFAHTSTSACALGAAVRAGYDPNDITSFACPECGRDPSTIIHLNDDHHWSRERIAEWLKEQGL